MKLLIDQNKCQPDPYVIKSKNVYYMYCTGVEGVDVYTSSDLLTWNYIGICFSLPSHKEYWAPSVIELDNTFYMYVSCVKESSIDMHEQTMLVATSSSPTGPFIKHGDLVKPFSIDSHIVKNDEGLYLFYSTNNYNSKRIGTVIVVDKMKNPFEVEGNPKRIISASIVEEMFKKNRFGDGKDWYTIEGAFYLKKGDYHFVFYSGNCFENEHYFISYAVCKSNSNKLNELEYVKYPSEKIYSPLFAKNETEEGTGHCSILEEKGKYYLFYHGRDYGASKEKDTRTTRVAEISILDDKVEILKR